jgi:hypothetical protein
MDDLKVALCFSGQIRTGAEVAPNIFNYLGELKENCDVFVHTWDAETTSPVMTQDNIPEHNRHKVNGSTFSRFHSAYSPISMTVEPHDLVEISDVFGGGRVFDDYPYPLLSMFESIYEANKLKKAHEEKYKFKYDYVVRIRPDIVFDPSKSLKEDLALLQNEERFFLVADHHGRSSSNNAHVEDIFWIASSEIMDELAGFVFVRARGNQSTDWQVQMSQWVKGELGLSFRRLKNNMMRIYYQYDLDQKSDIISPELGAAPHYGRVRGNQAPISGECIL